VVAALPPVAAVLETLERHKIHVVLYDYVRVEPTDASLRDAIEVASRESCDAFVAVGGGSAIDTAKIANLYSTHPPADFLDYVNPPIGKGHAVPGHCVRCSRSRRRPEPEARRRAWRCSTSSGCT
jgi:hydroxyacid-oxoacid transhydrogenase